MPEVGVHVRAPDNRGPAVRRGDAPTELALATASVLGALLERLRVGAGVTGAGLSADRYEPDNGSSVIFPTEPPMEGPITAPGPLGLTWETP